MLSSKRDLVGIYLADWSTMSVILVPASLHTVLTDYIILDFELIVMICRVVLCTYINAIIYLLLTLLYTKQYTIFVLPLFGVSAI